MNISFIQLNKYIRFTKNIKNSSCHIMQNYFYTFVYIFLLLKIQLTVLELNLIKGQSLAKISLYFTK